MPTTFPGESPEYRAVRDRLLADEKALRRATEAVAAARRALPPGGLVPEDYIFQGAAGDVRMSELFTPGRGGLAIYNFMYGPAMEEACSMCTSLLDALDGAADHAAQRVDLVVVARSALPRILAFAEQRGWRRLRLLSSLHNTYNRDYHGEDEHGAQVPMLNVFRRDGDRIRHFWGSELMFEPSEPGQESRHVDAISPLWNLFDVMPEGRGTDWSPSLSYLP